MKNMKNESVKVNDRIQCKFPGSHGGVVVGIDTVMDLALVRWDNIFTSEVIESWAGLDGIEKV
jgi:hypothetical protein